MKITVKDVYDPEKMNSLIIGEEESLETVIRNLAEYPGLRGIFVIDKAGKLQGVITRRVLLDYVETKLRKPLREIPFKTLMLKNILKPRVGDAVAPGSHRAAIKPEDDILKALDLMMELDLIDLPVINDEGKILGDLKLSAILLKLTSK